MKYPVKQSYRRITIRLRSPNAEFLRHHPNRGVSEKQFSEISKSFPVYQIADDRIELMLPKDHADLDSVINFAKSLSLNIESNRATKSQVEILDYAWHSEREVLTAEYLEGRMVSSVFDDCIDIIGGRPVVFIEKLKAANAYFFGSLTNLPNLIFIRGKARSRLKTSGLNGLDLQLVETDSPDGTWPDGMDPLYLVWSSIVLPHADMDVFDDQGNIRKSSECDWSDHGTVVYPLDGYEVQPILNYQKILPEVDVGLSKEHFGGHGYGYRRILYSQRAKALFEEVGMQLHWVPVRTGESKLPGKATTPVLPREKSKLPGK